MHISFGFFWETRSHSKIIIFFRCYFQILDKQNDQTNHYTSSYRHYKTAMITVCDLQDQSKNCMVVACATQQKVFHAARTPYYCQTKFAWTSLLCASDDLKIDYMLLTLTKLLRKKMRVLIEVYLSLVVCCHHLLILSLSQLSTVLFVFTS